MSETRTQATRVVLAARPAGQVRTEHFRIETTPVPEPADGQVLLRIRYLSLDPYMRGRMSAAKSYAAPVAIDGVMEGGTVGEVIASRHPDFAVGETVLSQSGWQSHALSDGTGLLKLTDWPAPISTALGVLGMPGFTAWSGLRHIGRPKPGETVAVAAASGAVGSAVGQIARIAGARTVGIAGGPRKCALLRERFGFDAAIDHRAPDFPQALAAACPDGIDVYFENVGGPVWDAVFPLLNPYARVPVCGLIAHYNDDGAAPGAAQPDRLAATMRQVLTKSLTIRGFIQLEFAAERPQFLTEMKAWVAEDRVRYLEDVVDGLEHAPEAFIGLLDGRNLGKLVVRLA